eukprot:gene20324-biopygen8544
MCFPQTFSLENYSARSQRPPGVAFVIESRHASVPCGCIVDTDSITAWLHHSPVRTPHLLSSDSRLLGCVVVGGAAESGQAAGSFLLEGTSKHKEGP